MNKPDKIPALMKLTISEAWVVDPFHRCETKVQRDDTAYPVTLRGSGRARVDTCRGSESSINSPKLRVQSGWVGQGVLSTTLPGKASRKGFSPVQCDGGGLAWGATSVPHHCSLSAGWDRAGWAGTSPSFYRASPTSLLAPFKHAWPTPLCGLTGCPLRPCPS